MINLTESVYWCETWAHCALFWPITKVVFTTDRLLNKCHVQECGGECCGTNFKGAFAYLICLCVAVLTAPFTLICGLLILPFACLYGIYTGQEPCD